MFCDEMTTGLFFNLATLTTGAEFRSNWKLIAKTDFVWANTSECFRNVWWQLAFRTTRKDKREYK